MNEPIFLKQAKPIMANILGVFVLILAVFLIYEQTAKMSQLLIMLLIVVLLLGHSTSYEIRQDLRHKKHFKLFGVTVFKQKLECIFPDYITVFSALFKKDAEWGPIAAMGKKGREGNYVVRFFKGNTHFTLWKTNSLDLANRKAMELGKLLNVEVKSKK